MPKLETIYFILGTIFILAALIKLFNIDKWWIRFFDFPQVQVLVIGLLVLVLSFFITGYEEWPDVLFLFAVVIAILFQLTIILPYTPLSKKEVPNARNGKEEVVRILVSNVYQPNRDYQRCIQTIKDVDPDMIVLLETDEGWQHALDQELQEHYAYQVAHPLDNMYGMMLYSRLDLEQTEIRFIVKKDIPSIRTHVKLKGLDKPLLLYALHPEPPSPTENERSTERDAELYLVARELKEVDQPVIVAGDLNDVAWSKSTRNFQEISRMLDPRKGRGFFNTFHASYWLLRWPLDHFFVSDHFSVKQMRRLDSIGSDHFPICIDLAYEPDRPAGNAPPKDGNTEDEATEKISESVA